MRSIYTPADHGVHYLINPTAHSILDGLYTGLQSPAINEETIWVVYGRLLEALTHADFDRSMVEEELAVDGEPMADVGDITPVLDSDGSDALNMDGRKAFDEDDDSDDEEITGYFTEDEEV